MLDKDMSKATVNIHHRYYNARRNFRDYHSFSSASPTLTRSEKGSLGGNDYSVAILNLCLSGLAGSGANDFYILVISQDADGFFVDVSRGR